MRTLFAMIFVATGCYGADFIDCTVACSSTSGCPSGLSCGVEGLCREPGIGQNCAAVLGDAGIALERDGNVGSQDGTIGLTHKTLSETATSAAIAGLSVDCVDGDNAWYRAFRLADFGITGTFHVSAVHLVYELSSNGSITVSFHNYIGPVGGSTLVEGQLLGSLASVNKTALTSSAPIGLVIPITIDVTDTFVVEITSTNSASNYFRLGANNSGESLPSYMKSSACGVNSPTEQTNVHFIIDVEGAY